MKQWPKGTPKTLPKVAKKAAANTREECNATMKKRTTALKQEKGTDSPSHLIDARIAALADWRDGTRARALIRQGDAQVVAPIACLRHQHRIHI